MSRVRPITVTVAALGGQGGGVVTDWLIDAARRSGYLAQATSVPGVAQRTGATIYYLEFFPRAQLPADGRKPIFALMPTPGDVDVVIASEIMEAGRAMQRGLVTERTTLIASSHRIYAIQEKSHMADGRSDSAQVRALAREQAKRYIEFDMQALAEANGSVISAAMLGALCGSDALPFAAEHYAEAIRAGGIDVAASTRTFDAARAAAAGSPAGDASQTGGSPEQTQTQTQTLPLRLSIPESFETRIRQRVPAAAQAVAREGVRRMIDYQDPPYASLYLDRLEAVIALENYGSQPFQASERFAGSQPSEGSPPLAGAPPSAGSQPPAGSHPYAGSPPLEGSQACALTESVARGLALWMSFEDTIRVADLKIRGTRSRRVMQEVRPSAGQLVQVTEFMKPRVEEICGTLPAGLGGWLMRSTTMRRWLTRFTGGRQISTSTIGGFLQLYWLAGLRRYRRKTLRYAEEQQRIGRWLEVIGQAARRNYALAVEIAECQQLVKGYGETHERGSASLDAILADLPAWQERAEAALRVRSLKQAALADDEGIALRAALAGATPVAP